MKLVYRESGKPVALNDPLTLHGEAYTVGHFAKPHKASSEGSVIMFRAGNPRAARSFYVSVIGAVWIEREDRGEA